MQGSTVVPEGGGVKIDIRRVQPVDRDTGDVVAWLGGLSLRDSKKKDALVEVMTALITFLTDGEEHSVASAALYLKESLGSAYEDTLRAQGFGRQLAAAVELFPEFVLTKKNYYLRLA